MERTPSGSVFSLVLATEEEEMRYINRLGAVAVLALGLGGLSGSYGADGIHIGNARGHLGATLTQFRARCCHPSHGGGNWVSPWYNTAAEAKSAGDGHTNAYNLEHRCSIEFGNSD
jgi:hypothetical protein